MPDTGAEATPTLVQHALSPDTGGPGGPSSPDGQQVQPAAVGHPGGHGGPWVPPAAVGHPVTYWPAQADHLRPPGWPQQIPAWAARRPEGVGVVLDPGVEWRDVAIFQQLPPVSNNVLHLRDISDQLVRSLWPVDVSVARGDRPEVRAVLEQIAAMSASMTAFYEFYDLQMADLVRKVNWLKRSADWHTVLLHEPRPTDEVEVLRGQLQALADKFEVLSQTVDQLAGTGAEPAVLVRGLTPRADSSPSGQP